MVTDPVDRNEDGPRAVSERYSAFELSQDEIVIFDGENSDAWIQSDRATSLVPDAIGELDG